MNFGIYLQARIDQSLPGPRSFSPIIGLSPLEIEATLEEALKNVTDFHQKNPEWKKQNPETKGNYFWSESFKKSCEKAKGQVTTSEHLATPQVLTERNGNSYIASYNPSIDERIAEILARFKRDEQVPVNQIFSKQLAKQREWVVEQQVKIAEYLCQMQDTYLRYGSPFDLNPLGQKDVAKELGYGVSTASRLLRNLTIQLPDGRVIFAGELVPGAGLTKRIGVHALRLLQEDAKLYENGQWKVSDDDLTPILEQEFGIKIARRTITKYRHILSDDDPDL